jgi:hypothetical protein
MFFDIFYLICAKGYNEVQEGDTTMAAAQNKERPTGVGRRRVSFTGFPVIMYMPETSVIFGGETAITIRRPDTQPADYPNIINFHAIYTLKNQIAVKLEPEFYFDNYKWKFNPRLVFQIFSGGFYSLGNKNSENDAERFTTEDFLFYSVLTRQVHEPLRLGSRYDLKKSRVLAFAPGGGFTTSVEEL